MVVQIDLRIHNNYMSEQSSYGPEDPKWWEELAADLPISNEQRMHNILSGIVENAENVKEQLTLNALDPDTPAVVVLVRNPDGTITEETLEK